MFGENLIEKTQKRAWRLSFVVLAFVVAVLYDIFIWNAALGLGFLLWVICCLTGFLILATFSKQLYQGWALLLLLPILIMSTAVVLYNNALVTVWAPWFVLILLFLFSLLLLLRNPGKHRFAFLKIPLFSSFELPYLKKLVIVFEDLFKSRREKKKTIYRKIILGVVIAAPILWVFGSLLAEADAIFADLMNKVFNFDLTPVNFWRVLRTLLITIILSALFYVIIDRDHSLVEKVRSVIKLDGTIVATILTLVNVLFLSFVIIQFRYLFGSVEYIFAKGITFADYARSGFFQLAWVIGLAALMLMFFYRSAAHHGSGKYLKFLKVLLIAQVVVMAVSALHRMNLYQDAYGFTVLRLYVEWIIYFTLLILVLAGISLLIKLPFRTFFYAVVILGLAALTAVSSINVDRMIARENVRRFVKYDRELDMEYLADLSADSVPIVMQLFERKNIDRLSLNQVLDLQKYIRRQEKEITKHYDFRELNAGVWKAMVLGVQIPPYAKGLLEQAADISDDYYQFSNSLRQYIPQQLARCTQYGINITEGDGLCQLVHPSGYPNVPAFAMSIVKKEKPNDKQQDVSIWIYERVYDDRRGTWSYKFVQEIYLESSHVDLDNEFHFIVKSPGKTKELLFEDGQIYHIAETNPEEKQYYAFSVIKDPDGYRIERVRKSKTLEDYKKSVPGN